MLIEFTVGNYRSFKDKVTFSMVAAPLTAPNPELDENNVFRVDDDLSLLKSAAIYGANASGKSNLAKAMGFMKYFMVNSSRETQTTDKIPIEPFRLSTETENQPSYFEIVFLLNNIIYRYGFEVTQEEVIAEWLYYVPKARETCLFERKKDTYLKLSQKLEASDIKKRTRSNALFLSVCAQFNNETAINVLKWTMYNTRIISSLNDSSFIEYTTDCLIESKNKKQIIELINNFDLGLDNIVVSERKVKPEDFLESDIPASIQRELIRKGTNISLVNTVHRKHDSQGTNDSSVLFNLEKHESEGTKKIFALAAPIIDILQKGKTFIIDEFDARLHPLISQAIVKLFNSNESNPNYAQLIFMTHDTNLLSNQLLRRDQIWFTEKDRYGATDLYSLAEYKDIRKDAAFEKNYIQGKYGAIPFLGDLSSVLD